MSISNFLYVQFYFFRIGKGLSIYLGTGVIHFLLLLNFSLADVDCSIHSYMCASIKMRKTNFIQLETKHLKHFQMLPVYSSMPRMIRALSRQMLHAASTVLFAKPIYKLAWFHNSWPFLSNTIYDLCHVTMTLIQYGCLSLFM